MESVINNKYYYFTQDTDIGTIKYGDGSSTIENGGMYNGYYGVFFHRTQPVTYSIRYVGDEIFQRDKYLMIALYAGLLTFLIVGLIIFKKKNKVVKRKVGLHL